MRAHLLPRAGLVAAAWLGLLAPAALWADDAARISRLESEVQQLRRQVDEQARRIQRLEEALKVRSEGAAKASAPRRPSPATAPAAPVTGREPWHSAAAWNRVLPGMTSAEVAAILGAPTSVDEFDALKTMFYRGTTGQGAELAGHVNLREDRVVAVSPPGFPPVH
ncbi:MAG TPA: hypothetical protein VFM30_04855 [Steroidobacteraceae bacterium]|nr:hypothetical protein [Steroidobacteraceae bacterium]